MTRTLMKMSKYGPGLSKTLAVGSYNPNPHLNDFFLPALLKTWRLMPTKDLLSTVLEYLLMDHSSPIPSRARFFRSIMITDYTSTLFKAAMSSICLPMEDQASRTAGLSIFTPYLSALS